MTRAWLVRADEGAGLDKFEKDGFVGIRGGAAEPRVVDVDLTDVDEAALADLVTDAGLPTTYTSMLRAIVSDMAIGDLVVSPGPHDELGQEVAVGTVSSEYCFVPTEPLRHRREVAWKGRVPRSQVPPRMWGDAMAALAEVDPREVPEPA
jgi:predicted Mrr-cat superfamily restriction endonuclease